MTNVELDRPTGAQLMKQGADQMINGVVGTLTQEIKVGGRFAVAGAVVGLVVGALDHRQSAFSTAWHTAKASAALGAFFGWETAAIPDNLEAQAEGLPTATFVDWLIANVLFFSGDTGQMEYRWGSATNSSVRLWPSVGRSLLINAETVAGAKTMIRGAWRSMWS